MFRKWIAIFCVSVVAIIGCDSKDMRTEPLVIEQMQLDLLSPDVRYDELMRFYSRAETIRRQKTITWDIEMNAMGLQTQIISILEWRAYESEFIEE